MLSQKKLNEGYKKVRALLNEDNWMKGEWKEGIYTNDEDVYDEDQKLLGYKYCLIGACIEVGMLDEDDAQNSMGDYLVVAATLLECADTLYPTRTQTSEGKHFIEQFNDDDETKIEDIHTVLDCAIAKTE